MMMTRLDSTKPVVTFEASISKARVDLFFKAVDWAQPTRPLMPPTLATAFRKGEFDAMDKIGVKLHKVLHGEQKYSFIKDIEPDVKYKGETYLTNQFEKAGGGGTMTFYVLQTNLIDSQGATCIECCTTIIVRS